MLYVVCLSYGCRFLCYVLLLSYSISSGALGSPEALVVF